MSRYLILLILFCLQAFTPLSAEDIQRVYQVELILFKHQDSRWMSQELWPDALPYSDSFNYTANDNDSSFNNRNRVFEQVSETAPANENTINDSLFADFDITANDSEIYDPRFVRVDASALQYKNFDYALSRYGSLTPLWHVAWQQPGLDSETAKAVTLSGEYQRTINYQIKESATPSVNSAYELSNPEVANADTASVGDSYQEEIDEQLKGTVKVRLERYLHVDVDLSYTTCLQQQSDTERCRWKQVNMLQSRKMRSSEMHYLDHPLFGVLVIVTPVEAGSES